MIRFAETFPDEQIVSALRRQLSWTHFKRLIYLDDPLKREFYAQMCRVENWPTRTLDKKINSMLFERTALSRKPEKLIEQELKLGDFKPADKGQMEFYLRWLDRYERRKDEDAPIGLILAIGYRVRSSRGVQFRQCPLTWMREM